MLALRWVPAGAVKFTMLAPPATLDGVVRSATLVPGLPPLLVYSATDSAASSEAFSIVCRFTEIRTSTLVTV